MKQIAYNLIIPFLLLCYISAMGQTKYFYNKYKLFGISSLDTRAMVEVQPNQFLFSGSAGTAGFSQYNLFFFEIDRHGEPIAEVSGITDTANVGINSLIKSDNGYVGAGWIDPDRTTSFFCSMEK